MTTNLIMRVNVRTTTTTAALEAHNLKKAYQVYIVDYYYRLFTAVSSIARAHGMLSRRCLLLIKIAAVSSISNSRVDPFSKKKNCPRIQNPKTSPIFGCVSSYLSYVVCVHDQVGDG